MSTTQEATVNPDGSTTFAEGDTTDDYADANNNTTDSSFDGAGGEELFIEKGIDPAYILLFSVVIIGFIYWFVQWRRSKAKGSSDDFFGNLDGEKFNVKLPAAVDEYLTIKEKCLDSGWEPGTSPGGPAAASNGPHRVLAQALMKRCIADIPLVTHIQKESAGMNKLYSNSMCSVQQWRMYQAAEALVSTEVDDVRAEADEIEPGWSQVIWRQAMQYHNMLKQKHETELKAQAQATEKKKVEENKVMIEKRKIEDAKQRVVDAERTASELIKAEEREKQSKQAFNGGGMKKGFLSKKK